MSSVFDEKEARPDDDALTETLGRTRRHWDEILAHARDVCDGLGEEWKFYGRKHGWQLKLQARKRGILYLVPHRKSFLAGMAIRESAMDLVRKSRLPADLKKEIEDAKPFMEGRPAHVEVTNLRHVASVKKLIDLKLSLI